MASYQQYFYCYGIEPITYLLLYHCITHFCTAVASHHQYFYCYGIAPPIFLLLCYRTNDISTAISLHHQYFYCYGIAPIAYLLLLHRTTNIYTTAASHHQHLNCCGIAQIPSLLLWNRITNISTAVASHYQRQYVTRAPFKSKSKCWSSQYNYCCFGHCCLILKTMAVQIPLIKWRSVSRGRVSFFKYSTKDLATLDKKRKKMSTIQNRFLKQSFIYLVTRTIRFDCVFSCARQ